MATNANNAGPNIPNKTRFIDLVENEKNAILTAERLLGELKAREKRVEKLGEADSNEYERLTSLLAFKDKAGRGTRSVWGVWRWFPGLMRQSAGRRR